MEMMKFLCPACGAKVKGRIEYAGKVAVCPACGGKMRVPGADVADGPWKAENAALQKRGPAPVRDTRETGGAQRGRAAAGGGERVRWKRLVAVGLGAACLVCAAIVAEEFLGKQGYRKAERARVDSQANAGVDSALTDAEKAEIRWRLESSPEWESFTAETKARLARMASERAEQRKLETGEALRPWVALPPTGSGDRAKELSADALFKKASPAVVRVEVRDGELKPTAEGSGFFVSDDGLIVTNYHVIEGAYYASVRLDDESVFFVEGVAAVDTKADLAVLKVKAAGATFLKLGQAGLPAVGTRVYAIGNPQGLTNTLSEGIVSGQRADEEGDITLIQTTAAISSGSSGGPLMTADGCAVGVTTSFFEEGQNLNFAVPAQRVMILLKGRGKLEPLASAGGGRLELADARKIKSVWEAILEEEYAKALELLAELREQQQGSAGYWMAMGMVQGRLGNDELAVAAYTAAARLAPDNGHAYGWLGSCYLRLKQVDKALAAYSSAVRLRPDDWYGYSGLGHCYRDMEEYEKAISAYASAKRVCKSADVATMMNREIVTTYVWWGRDAELSKDFEGAVKALEQALKVNPADERARKALLSAHCRLGFQSLRWKDWPEAIRQLSHVIELEPDHWGARSRLGEAYEGLEEWGKAIKQYEYLIRLKPKSSVGYCQLADAFTRAGRVDDAIAILKEYLAVNTDAKRDTLEFVYYHLGEAYLEAGKREAALDAYRKGGLLGKIMIDVVTVPAQIEEAKGRWRKLQRGMTRSQVSRLLGGPDRVEAGSDGETWYYSSERVARVYGYVGFWRNLVSSWHEPSWR